MEPYIEIILEDKIYSQRTPNSKFIEFTLDGIKQNTYEELPSQIQKLIDEIIDSQEHPEKYFKFEYIKDGIKIIDWENLDTYIKIPEKINDTPVVEIGKISKKVLEKVKYINLPKTIKRFNESSFAYAENLIQINIPKSVKEIPDECFGYCSSLKNIEVSHVDSIGNYAFKECTSLRKMDISNTSTLGMFAFFHCTKLESITFSPLLNTIKDNTFYSCESLTKIKLPEALEYLECNVFESCINLKEIIFPKSLRYIGDFCFFYCKSLKEFVAPENLRTLDICAFSESGLENIILNEKLEKINSSVFSDCKNIKTITLYNNSLDCIPNIQKSSKNVVIKNLSKQEKNIDNER